MTHWLVAIAIVLWICTILINIMEKTASWAH